MTREILVGRASSRPASLPVSLSSSTVSPQLYRCVNQARSNFGRATVFFIPKETRKLIIKILVRNIIYLGV